MAGYVNAHFRPAVPQEDNGGFPKSQGYDNEGVYLEILEDNGRQVTVEKANPHIDCRQTSSDKATPHLDCHQTSSDNDNPQIACHQMRKIAIVFGVIFIIILLIGLGIGGYYVYGVTAKNVPKDPDVMGLTTVETTADVRPGSGTGSQQTTTTPGSQQRTTTPAARRTTTTLSSQQPTATPDWDLACFTRENCLLRTNFQSDDVFNTCKDGDRYVRWLPTYDKYLGISTCSTSRFHLFMAETPSAVFKNIGDGAGHGQDQCEFLGDPFDGTAPNDFRHGPVTEGYYRYSRGEELRTGAIGQGNGKYYSSYLECPGVEIPGQFEVEIGPVFPTTVALSPTTAVPDSDIPCLRMENCLLRTHFQSDDVYNACEYGERYVRYLPTLGKYLGITTCSPTRFHLFMAETLSAVFKNIADGSGEGEDHCEFLGDPSNGTVRGYRHDSPSTEGYYRNFRGENMRQGSIGWRTGIAYGHSLSCHVEIPGLFNVELGPNPPTPSTVAQCHIMEGPVRLSVPDPNPDALYGCDGGPVGDDYQVHVLAMYEPVGGKRGFQEDPEIVGEVEVIINARPGVTPLPVKLGMFSYEATHWVLKPDNNVNVIDVAIVSYYESFSSLTVEGRPTPALTKVRDYEGYGEYPRRKDLKKAVEERFGFMTSFGGVYRASAWTVTLTV